MAATPTIVAAAAAAVLSTKYLPDDERDSYEGQRFFVHPHIATVGPREPALTTYLEDIYGTQTRSAVDVPAPSSSSFQALGTKTRVVEATSEIAEALRQSMESKSANPGIVFGFLLRLEGGEGAHGIVKADLENAERFFMDMTSEREWSIASVRDILPPPQTKYAKYAIAPRPKGPGAAGIRDTQADPDSAAEYFLSAIGLVVPRRKGTKAAIARAAKQAGYGDAHIRSELDAVKQDSPVEDIVSSSFPDISEAARERLKGSAERPMNTVFGDESFLTTWSTRQPTFRLTVDTSVTVEIQGHRITVTLPDDHDEIDRKYEK